MRRLILLGVVLLASCGVSAQAAGPSTGEIPWSFQPLKKPVLPKVENAAWVCDDLDRYILARLEAEKVTPAKDADRATLLRRLTFDLTGLPPTERQLSEYLADSSPDDRATAKVVDALLASPQFGERWARHWLDIARYADSVGRTYNPPFTYAWRYRDYVIDALNKDKPYDRFLTEQLSGDLLPYKSLAERRENLTATGFLALGSYDLQAIDRRQYEMDCLDDQIDVTTRAMLGLTVACARCHDHKYDPIGTRDYYALAGIFQSTRLLPGVSYRGEGNGYTDHERLVVLPVSKAGQLVTPTVVSGVHSMNDWNDVWRRGERKIFYTTDPNLAMGVAEDDVADCAVRIKGDPHDRGEVPRRGDVRIPNLPALTKPAEGASGRLELARWIASPENPLTARVITNRVWLHLFGKGLANSLDDFGVGSERPSHPELLDHLAVRLSSDGWSLKRLIRAIVLSHTYRLGSESGANPAAKSDPDNRLYWRSNLRRLELEPLRDALLAAAGRLTLERPEGIQVTGIGGKSNKTSATSLLSVDSRYRTIYLPVLRSRLSDAYGTFDFPDPCQIIGRREVTTVAPQALFFMNGSLASDCASSAASWLAEQRLASDSERANWLYKRILGRDATAEEAREATAFVNDLSSTSAASRWATLAQALMCSAEFRYVR